MNVFFEMKYIVHTENRAMPKYTSALFSNRSQNLCVVDCPLILILIHTESRNIPVYIHKAFNHQSVTFE